MKSMYKQLEFTQLNWDGAAAWELNTFNTAPAFLSLSANNPQVIYQGGYFDLAGMTNQEKTLFIQGLDIQMAYAPLMNNGITGDNVSITLVIADRPLSPTFSSYVAPGFIGGDLDAQNVIFNRHQTWAITQDSSSLSNYTVLMNETSGGICSSTASDRIYWGVALLPNVIKVGITTSTVDSITFPPMRIRIFFNASEEAEYQYLMRLKRSFDLQQSFDVDGRRPH